MTEDQPRSQQLKKLVQDLTNSGKSTLNEDKLKILKKICKSSDCFIIELYDILLKQLKRRHAEVRLSAFQICNEIFMRSHCFRELLLKNFKKINELVILFDSNSHILKPLATAKMLKTLAIKSVHSWYEKYKDGYKLLNLGYEYLRDCKDIDFEAAVIINNQDRQRREDERRKEEEVRNRRIQKVENELEEKIPDILALITEFHNTFKLLIPGLDNFFIPLQNDDINEPSNVINYEYLDKNFEFGSNEMREHGINKETTVQVNLSNIHRVQETPDNEVIVTTLREQSSNIKKNILTQVKEWEQSIMRYSSFHPELIQKIIDIKAKLETSLKRYESINIIPQYKGKAKARNLSQPSIEQILSTELSDSDDDDDFIDVPMDDPRVIQASASEAALLESNLRSSIKDRALKTGINLLDLEAAGSSGLKSYNEEKCKRDKKQSKAPINLDVDSFIEGSLEKPLKFHASVPGLTSIWSANEVLHDHEEDIVKPSDILGIATRAVDFQRKWEPVRWECRAPLASGRLCPRKDRERCPLHGPVIQRDNLGRPVGSENIRKEQERLDAYERANPAWQNPILLAEIRASTGVDLDIKKAKKKKKKYSNLTDLRAAERTPRKRLEKRVLSKKSLRRINNSLAKLPY